ncbi:flagellar motor protein MotD [Thioalkalivibrio versutus]|uniref:Flagellar motor protein MotD n=1 Tax=Thioalkalivibrio versutus TaxID=106634 RepID=A0A0G3G1B4_9GAMM|nr:flagellar motor protein MotD [Thioalkalivibrio versutus]AKJ95005.1 flagellar motor protein MotD [Thioalkalivibrio versutus]
MARRKRAEEHQNHEAWAIPYGDLVTLLLAFFVVMYAISSVDDGKYRVLSESLVDAFRAPMQADPIQVGDSTVARERTPQDLRALVPIEVQPGLVEEGPQPIDMALSGMLDEGPDDAGMQAFLDELADTAREIEQAMAQWIEDGDLRVTREAYWLEIEITSRLLFASGAATLNPQAEGLLQEVGGILAPRVSRVHVEGHTDNVPIQTAIYPSNWELSSGRAAAVVSVFEEVGVDPENLVALGYGEHRPTASNDTAEGRAENRRVSIVVLPGARPRAEGAQEPERLREDLPPAPLPTDGDTP